MCTHGRRRRSIQDARVPETVPVRASTVLDDKKAPHQRGFFVGSEAVCLVWLDALRARYLVHDIVLARVVYDLEPELLAGADLRHRLVLDLHGFHALAEVAGVAEDMDGVADA